MKMKSGFAVDILNNMLPLTLFLQLCFFVLFLTSLPTFVFYLA